MKKEVFVKCAICGVKLKVTCDDKCDINARNIVCDYCYDEGYVWAKAVGRGGVKMEPDVKDVVAAIKVIRGFCAKHEDCDECPLQYCGLTDYESPDQWVVEDA